MKILVTGSAGHLGEALVRTLRRAGRDVVGLDIVRSPFTSEVGSVADRDFVRRCMAGVGAVLHAATLHKPHVGTHSKRAFVDVNVVGTLNLLEEAVAAGVSSFVFTSTTSTFGRALSPPPGAPAAWVTEDLAPVAKNIYGATKVAAEDLCRLVHREQRLPCVVLRTSRFFPDLDDDEAARGAFDDSNLKVNELLFRRVDVADVVSAHLLALEKAPAIGFGLYVVSATSPFSHDDLVELRADAPAVVRRYVPEYADEYARRGWSMPPSIDRVYVNERARRELGWQPEYDFALAVDRLRRGLELRSDLAIEIGSKGYHDPSTVAGIYPFV